MTAEGPEGVVDNEEEEEDDDEDDDDDEEDDRTMMMMMITMPAKAPLRVIRKLHFPVLFQRNCKIEVDI